MRMAARWRLFVRNLRPGLTVRLVVLAALVGILGGAAALVLTWVIHWSTDHLLVGLTGFSSAAPSGEGGSPGGGTDVVPWLLTLVPAAGGLLSGWLVWKFAPEAEGHGTDAMIRSYHRGGGDARGRVAIVKTIASGITVGTGGSAGREGPIAQIAGVLGSKLAGALRLTVKERRVLLVAGAAGGVGAMFRAPLGGALFASEVLYRDPEIESDSLLPSIFCSIVAYSVYVFGATWLLPGDGARLFGDLSNLRFTHLGDLPAYVVLGALCAAAGWLHVRVFYGARDRLFGRLPVPAWVRPGIGGLILGLMATAVWSWSVAEGRGLGGINLLGGGYGLMQEALDGRLSVQGSEVAGWSLAGLLLGLACLKMFATAASVSSGGSGGVFSPTLAIGALLGGAVGAVCASWVEDPRAFVLVGMGGFFAGIAKIPLTSVIMVSEMTQDYGLILPMMLVSGIAFVTSQRWTLYQEQVPGKVDSPAHRGDFLIDVLEEVSVAEVMEEKDNRTFVAPGTPLRQILKLVSETTAKVFVVVDDDQKLIGVFAARDVRRIMQETEVIDLVCAVDIATPEVVTADPAEDLGRVLHRMTQYEVDALPVMDPQAPGRVVGVVTEFRVMSVYDERLTGAARGR